MTELKEFKYVTALVIELKKKIDSDDKTQYSTFYSFPKAETLINECDIDDVLESI